MTKTRVKGGPYLLAALLCERILEEKDGTKSAIRIVDRVTKTETGPNPPQKMEPFGLTLEILIRLVPGQARGDYLLEISVVSPSGKRQGPLRVTVSFKEESSSVNVKVNAMLVLGEEGLYWFQIKLGKKQLTQIPLKVIHEAGQASGSEESPSFVQ